MTDDSLAKAENITGTADFWDSEPYRLLTMQDLIDAGIPIFGIEGMEPANLYVKADAGIQEQVWRRLEERGKALPPARIILSDVHITRHEGTAPCPYCSNPEGWDACPVHPHGAPTPPPATPTK